MDTITLGSLVHHPLTADFSFSQLPEATYSGSKLDYQTFT